MIPVEEAETPVTEEFGPQDGVIEEARERQRRRRARLTLALLALAAVSFAVVWAGDSGARRASLPVRLSSSPRWLSGRPLTTTTHLRLVTSGTGAADMVDVDSDTVRVLTALGAGRGHSLYPLARLGDRALAVVTRELCRDCTTTVQTEFLVSADGSVRRLARLALTRHEEALQAHSSTADWLERWPHRGPCTLRLVPGERAAVRVPCGALVAATAQGVWVVNGDVHMLIDPLSGRVRERLDTADELTFLPGDLALESTPGPEPTDLALLDLATGARRALRWPSILSWDYSRVLPEPHGPLVAIEFASPWGRGTVLAADVWVLDTRTGRFSHVPRFPILEDLKSSNIAWTDDDRLVVVAQGGGRTVLGLWRPGQSTLAVRPLPAVARYWEFVPLTS